MNRRGLLSSLAGLPFIGIFSTKATAASYRYVETDSKESSDRWDQSIYGLNVRNFQDLKSWLNKLPLMQVDGSETEVCQQSGKPYICINLGAFSRPGEERFSERLLAARMQWAIINQIEVIQPKLLKDITIYWRERLELDTDSHSAFDEYRYDGPDVDDFTGRSYIKDHNFLHLNAYCRLSVTTKETYSGNG